MNKKGKNILNVQVIIASVIKFFWPSSYTDIHFGIKLYTPNYLIALRFISVTLVLFTA